MGIIYTRQPTTNGISFSISHCSCEPFYIYYYITYYTRYVTDRRCVRATVGVTATAVILLLLLLSSGIVEPRQYGVTPSSTFPPPGHSNGSRACMGTRTRCVLWGNRWRRPPRAQAGHD